MTIRPILIIPDEILRAVASPVAKINGKILKQIKDMFETMYDAPGIGLAAPQIGILNRVIVVDCAIRESQEKRRKLESGLDNELDRELDESIEDADQDASEPIADNDDDIEEFEEIPDPIAMINPQIIWFSEEMSVHEEGCLSIPDFYEDVERPASCRVKYLDPEGKTNERELEGLLATVVQHEVDHLNGKLFIDYISRLKREMITKKFHKAAKRTTG